MKLLKFLFPILIILLSYNLVAYNLNFYKYEFSKQDVYSSLNKADVDKEAENLINYFKTGKLETTFFNEKELIHLKDVYNLNKVVCYLFYSSLILISVCLLFLLYNKKYKELYKDLFHSGLISLCSIIALLILVIINFNFSFTLFHEILFTNDLWQLNPETDNLIVMFPEGFFIDTFIRIIIYSVTFSLILVLAGEILTKSFPIINKSSSK